MASSAAPAAGPKLTTIDLVGGIFCHICKSTYAKKKEYDSHYAEHNTGSADIIYTCVACHKEIVGYPSFRGHCYTHHIMKDKFKCDPCGRSFSKLTALAEHTKAIHTFTCSKPLCKKQFSTKKELHLHSIFHKNEDNRLPYKCQTCTKEILTIDSCELHIDKHYSIVYTCPICLETLSKEEATKHIASHFDNVLKEDSGILDSSLPDDSSLNIVGGIKCCYCKTLYKNREDFDTHFFAAHKGNELVYTCNICNKKIGKYSLFGNHCYHHTAKNKFECDMCWKRFSRLSLLVSHMEMHGCDRDATEGLFPCTNCERRFDSERRLRDHLRAAHHTTYILCPHPGCGEKLSSSKELSNHRQYHKTNLDRWCRQCGLQFPTLTSCEKHLNVHKKKQFTCPVCSKHYGERYLLMKHVPAHFETVLHVCNVCGKVYNAKNRLIAHMKSHAASRDYKCTICGKGFVRSDHLRQHLNIHSGARPYTCHVCSKTFGAHSNWHKHLRKTHSIDPRTVPRPHAEIPIHEAKVTAEKSVPTTNEQGDTEETDESMVETSLESNLVEMIPHFDDDMIAAINDYSLEELTNVALPNEVDAFVPEITETQPEPQVGNIPCEYGPDFVSSSGGGSWAPSGGVIPLDEPLLPHIDPLLTINASPGKYQFTPPLSPSLVDSIDPCPKWEPPVITKFYVF